MTVAERSGRAAVYCRVSKENEKSIDGQELECRRYAASQRWEVVRVYREDGHPASEEKAWTRPVFNQMMEDAERGEFNVLLVWESSRISRNALHSKLVKSDLRKIGVHIAYANRPGQPDASEDDGAFLLEGIEEILAEMETRQTSRRIRRAKKHRAEKGLWNGDNPYGYCRGNCLDCRDPNGPGYCPEAGKPSKGDGRVLIPHPRDGEGLRLAFEWYVADHLSDRQVAERLNAAGYRTNRKHTVKKEFKREGGPHPFTKDTVCFMLQNPFYLGMITWKKDLRQGQHPALISPDLFAQAQQARKLLRSVRQGQAPPTYEYVYLLTGLLHCAHGHAMRGHGGKAGWRYYVDSAQQQRHGCDQRPIRAEKLDGEIGDFVSSLALPPDWETEVRRQLGEDEEENAREQARLGLRLRSERLAQLYLDRMIEESDYQAEKRRIDEQRAKLDSVEVKRVLQAGEMIISMPEIWAAATPFERKGLLNLLFEEVIVEGDRIAAVTARSDFYPLLVTTEATGVGHAATIKIIPP